MVANAGKDVGHLPARGRGLTDTIGSQQRQTMAPRKFNHCLVARFFIAIEVALQLRVNILLPKDVQHPGNTSISFFRAIGILLLDDACEWSIVATRQTD